ncbi:ribose-phosphate pyrophosphokinase-like domain-containing protein [Candidatus Vidania fulgoroideorum]
MYLKSKKFNDGETFINIKKIKKSKKFIILFIFKKNVNDSIIDILFTSEILKRNFPSSKIILFSPYLFYSRQEKITKKYSSIAFKLIINLLKISGVEKIVTFDLHSPSLIDYTNIKIKNFSLIKLIYKNIIKKKKNTQ